MVLDQEITCSYWSNLNVGLYHGYEKRMPLILVGQLSKLTQKTSRALRMYETWDFFSIERSSNGYRKYNQKSIDQVKYIEHYS